MTIMCRAPLPSTVNTNLEADRGLLAAMKLRWAEYQHMTRIPKQDRDALGTGAKLLEQAQDSLDEVLTRSMDSLYGNDDFAPRLEGSI